VSATIYQANRPLPLSGSDMQSVGIDETDLHWMKMAFDLASTAAANDEVPVGAVLVSEENQCIGQGRNQPISNCDPTAHAEILALRDAAKQLGNYRLPNTTLYVTLEPCPMCAGAIVHARVKRIVIATPDPRSGSAGSVYDLLNSPYLNHNVEVTCGVLQNECSNLLKRFFKNKRKSEVKA